ncbi:MAG: dephospho-CoA kinase [Bacteroidales bacterium]|nr:dephospho-CoA kinase [Bacteroidales bacterium]
MTKVGLTGGIGAGKTIVAQIFRMLEVPVFVADEEAKKLLNEKEVIDFYKTILGHEIITDGVINIRKTALKLFEHPEYVEKINTFIHPLVDRKFEEWCAKNSSNPYVIKESAILFETNLYRKLDYTILVTAPIDLRFERLKKSRKMSVEEIRSRMQHQWSDDQKMKLANWIINNDDKTPILPQVINIHEYLSKL